MVPVGTWGEKLGITGLDDLENVRVLKINFTYFTICCAKP
jgi:hypothetical protein